MKPQEPRRLKSAADPEMIMKGRIAAAAAVASLVLGAATAAPAQDYPTFERNGYPLTPLQLQVLGSDRVQERAPPSTLVGDSMPASPHQLAVLRQANGTAAH
jgi:hypothetical protein